MSSNEAEAAFAPLSGGKQTAGVPAFEWKGEALELREASAQGGARLTMEALPAKKTGVVTTTAMAADHMESVFPDAAGGLAKMHGEGHTEFRQTDTAGGEQTSHGDAMDVVFRMKDGTKNETRTANAAVLPERHDCERDTARACVDAECSGERRRAAMRSSRLRDMGRRTPSGV